MSMWFAKMAVKILKPFAKFAILAGLIGSILEALGVQLPGGDNEPGADPTDPTDPADPDAE